MSRSAWSAPARPTGYEELHARLLDALKLYIRASAALLPDRETAKADYSRFQESMLQGGDAAIAAFEQLRRKAR